MLAARGYEGISIEAIAEEAGVSRPVVYGLFANLGELLAALLERQQERALRQLADAVPAEGGERDPDQVIVESLLAFLRAVARDPDTWRLILLPPEGTPAAVSAHVERNRAAILRQIEALVAWGLERRGGPAELDVELVARTIQVGAEDAGRLVLNDPERFPPERLARFATTLLAAVARG